MPGYGMCSACGETVWLTESGACPKGHGPEYISGVVETAPQGAPTPLPVPPAGSADDAKKSRTLIIAVVVIVLLLLCCLVSGILVSIAIPVFNAASTAAGENLCLAQQRVMEGAAMQWAAESEGNDPAQLDDFDALVEVTVPAFVYEEPVCPDAGTYEYDPVNNEVSCTLHGHYK